MITKIKNFFIGSYLEFKKVVWPSRKEVTAHTLIVVISTLIAMAIIAAIDFGLFSLVQMLIQGKWVLYDRTN